MWFFSNLYEIALGRTPLDPTDDKSTLVQVMAWCRQATSHYLNQWWHRSMSSYGSTRPQWVNDQHIETWTKFTTFCRWHFQTYFLKWMFGPNVMSVKYLCKALIDKTVSLGSGNGLAPSGIKPSAHACNDVDHDLWSHKVSRGHSVNELTHWPLLHVAIILKSLFSSSLYKISTWSIAVKFLSGACHRTSLMISQRWFR